MGSRVIFTALCLVLCCTAASAGRMSRLLPTFINATTPFPEFDNDVNATGAPAEGPSALAPGGALAFLAAPGLAVASAPGASAPAPSGATNCTVEFNANVHQQSSGSSTSYSGPACVIVMPGISQAACSQRATADQLTLIPTSDPACLYPSPQSCSSLASGTPDCSASATQNIQAQGQKGTFDSALAANMAAATQSTMDSINNNIASLFSPTTTGFPGFGTSG